MITLYVVLIGLYHVVLIDASVGSVSFACTHVVLHSNNNIRGRMVVQLGRPDDSSVMSNSIMNKNSFLCINNNSLRGNPVV